MISGKKWSGYGVDVGVGDGVGSRVTVSVVVSVVVIVIVGVVVTVGVIVIVGVIGKESSMESGEGVTGGRFELDVGDEVEVIVGVGDEVSSISNAALDEEFLSQNKPSNIIAIARNMLFRIYVILCAAGKCSRRK